MAYILQHRRDTIENWNSVNPVLADAEIGFILDLDENGKQKSSTYKIGDGRTAWTDLPLFGFGGDVYDNFIGDDLSVSVASRRAVIEKINEIVNSADITLKNEILNGTEDFEGLLNKLSVTQLVQLINPGENEVFGEDINSSNNKLPINQISSYLEKQIVSRLTLINEFNSVWKSINDLTEDCAATDEDVKTLLEFAEVFGPAEDFKTLVESHSELLEEHDKFINGWDEINEETQETVRHKGVDEKLEDLSNKIFNIMSKSEYKNIQDFSNYPEGTLFFTYEDEE